MAVVGFGVVFQFIAADRSAVAALAVESQDQTDTWIAVHLRALKTCTILMVL